MPGAGIKPYSVTYDPEETTRAVAEIRSFIDSYRGRRKVFLLVGPFGCGKSWCLHQIGGEGVINLNLHLARAAEKRLGERFGDAASAKPETELPEIGSIFWEEYENILNQFPSPVLIDNIELLYTYPYFDFIAEAERLAITKNVIIAIPGFLSHDDVYFIDLNLFNLRIDTTRVDRYFELRGVRR